MARKAPSAYYLLQTEVGKEGEGTPATNPWPEPKELLQLVIEIDNKKTIQRQQDGKVTRAKFVFKREKAKEGTAAKIVPQE